MSGAVVIPTCRGRGGASRRCAAAYRDGRPVHIIPPFSSATPTIVLPDYHYATEADARAALAAAADAPVVSSAEELYAARDAGVAHRLPVGWQDPARRRPAAPAAG